MTEIRYIREYTDAVLTAEISYPVSDEQLAEESRVAEIGQVKSILTQDWTVAQMQAILKKVIVRLIEKELLP